MKSYLFNFFVVVIFSAIATTAIADNKAWKQWFSAQIRQHPTVEAAYQNLLSEQYQAQALEQPLFNPALSSSYEKSGTNKTVQIGVEQTIDWWDIDDSREQEATFVRQAAEAEYQQLLLNQTAQALIALIDWEAATQAAQLAEELNQQLDSLVQIVQKRQASGDLSSVDAELTFLAQARRLAELASLEAELEKATTKVSELLPGWTPDSGGIPVSFWQYTPKKTGSEQLLSHPAIIAAKSRWRAKQQQIESLKKSLKAAPTVGINAGKDVGENLLGVSVSIPLNLRNNFAAETKAASKLALSEESRYLAALREHQYRYDASFRSWSRFAKHLRRWQALTKGRASSSKNLLKTQWRKGDLSTAEYLLALNERAESVLAGIRLQQDTHMALIEVLNMSGVLARLVELKNEE